MLSLPIALALGLALGSAGARPAGPVPRSFDEARAYALVKLQLSYGPRPAGSPAERAVARVLVRMLPHGHFEPVPGGLENIVGGLPGRQPAIVIAAHYDTTPVPGYLGANNSATGVAAVIEMARDLARDPRRSGQRAIVFALFDGEEAPVYPPPDFLAEALRGSRAYVAAHRASTREMVLLDFIALHGESLPRDAGSNATLWSQLRAAARRAGTLSYFPDAVGEAIYDDDTPFNQAGIPAIDLIDFNYPCWQKVCDDLTQVSQPSLAAVGRTVLALLRSERGS